MDAPKSNYGSRKFITTNSAMMTGAAVLIAGVLLKAPEGFWSALPAFFILQGAGIGAYNWANVRSQSPPDPQ